MRAVEVAGERWARIAWSRLAEPADAEVASCVRDRGHEGALSDVLGGRGPLHARLAARVAALDPERDLARATRVGARAVVPGEPDWPSGLDRLLHPPHCLWVRGDLDLGRLCARSVSVVGARAATGYGELQAMDLGSGLAERGFTVVSGAAFGIDAAAHRGALAVAGATVAVLACGPDQASPSSHRGLIDAVAAAGAVVSEVPVGSAPLRARFLSRNRLIAALTGGTVVVEAGLRSGSLNTARAAAELGRVVMALPGPVTSMVSAGCHQAVRDGLALLVTDAAEVADAVGDLGRDRTDRPSAPALPEDALPAGDRAVHDGLRVRRETSVGQLVTRTTLRPSEVLAALGRLEGRGLAERGPDGGWRRVDPAGRPLPARRA